MDFWQEAFWKKIREVRPNDFWTLTMDRNLQLHTRDARWKSSLQQHAQARFTCSRCLHSWSSHQVVILFHMHWTPHGTGQVRVRFFRQKCHSCTGNYEDPQFNMEEIVRTLKHLILDIREKCYGEAVDRSELSEMVWRPSLPHKSQYCEACHLGIHKTVDGWSKGAGHHGSPQSPGYLSTVRPASMQHSWKQESQPPAQFSDSTEEAYLVCILISILILMIVVYCWAK